jgi:hypothetical protein
MQNHRPCHIAPLAAWAEATIEMGDFQSCLPGRFVHEVKAAHVLDPQRLQLQHHPGQVAPLDLRHSRVLQRLESGLGVEAEALPRGLAPRSAAALAGLRLLVKG